VSRELLRYVTCPSDDSAISLARVAQRSRTSPNTRSLVPVGHVRVVCERGLDESGPSSPYQTAQAINPVRATSGRIDERFKSRRPVISNLVAERGQKYLLSLERRSNEERRQLSPRRNDRLQAGSTGPIPVP